MLGAAAATVAGLSSEVWLAEPGCPDGALQILAGLPQQAFLCSTISSRGSSTNGMAAAGSVAFSKRQATLMLYTQHIGPPQ